MSVFVKSTGAPTPKSPHVKGIATIYAAILVLFALAQLYSFEEFSVLFVEEFSLSIPFTLTVLLAPLIVTLEVLALPFLLRMRLSPAFRFLSMMSGWFVAVIWAWVSLWAVIREPYVETIGLLGTVISLPAGWWAVLLSLGLGLMAAWASWGMWPLATRRRRK